MISSAYNFTKKDMKYISWKEREKILEERRKRKGKQIDLSNFGIENPLKKTIQQPAV